MTPEWEELKRRLKINIADQRDERFKRGVEYAIMQILEIEKRTLPERVAELLENAVMCNHWHGPQLLPVIAKALRTGDLTELEKWQRKT